MKCNVGKTDKVVRWLIGLAAIVLGIVYKSWWGVVGLIPILTALASYCPIYSLLKVTTCKVEKK